MKKIGKSSTEKSHKTSETEEKWWISDFGKKASGKAFSSYWTSKFDDFWSKHSIDKSSGTDFNSILSSVRRSANIVSNASSRDEQEKELTVRWATTDKDRNTSKTNEVFLSPAVVDENNTQKPNWSCDERTDVLIGEALVQSTMKKTVSSDVESDMLKKLKEKGNGKLINNVWTVFEHLYAENEVLKNYPGFRGYFAANREYYTGEDAKKHFQDFLSKQKNFSPELAVTSFLWEILHPNDGLNLQDDLRKFVEWSKERFSEERKCRGRAAAAEDIVNQAEKLWGADKTSSSSKEGKKSSEIASKTMQEMGLSEIIRGEKIDHADIDPSSLDGKPTYAKKSYHVPKSIEEVSWFRGTKVVNVKAQASTEKRYQSHVRRLNPIIRELKGRLKIRAEEQRMVERALKKGRLDDGSLYKLGFHSSDFKDEKIFEQEEIISMPKVAFGILIDESGSMGCGSSLGTRADSARDLGIIISNACVGLEGLQLCVWGHTANGSSHDAGTYFDGLVIHNYYTPDNPHLETLAEVSRFYNNLDGYAIAHASQKMIHHFPNYDARVLIHVSDGDPEANHYTGIAAKDHVRGVCKLAKSRGVKVIGIGIDNAFSEADGTRMYGDGNFAILKTVSGLAGIVSNLLVKAASTRL